MKYILILLGISTILFSENRYDEKKEKNISIEQYINQLQNNIGQLSNNMLILESKLVELNSKAVMLENLLQQLIDGHTNGFPMYSTQ